MRNLIIIEADTNDADYVEKASYIDDQELLLIKPIIEELKIDDEFTTHDQGDRGEERFGNYEGYKIFANIVPRPEYGIHTIESIRLLTVLNEEKLL